MTRTRCTQELIITHDKLYRYSIIPWLQHAYKYSWPLQLLVVKAKDVDCK